MFTDNFKKINNKIFGETLRRFTRSHLKKRILVQDQGGVEFQPAGPPRADRDLKRGPNAEVGPKDFFEIASNRWMTRLADHRTCLGFLIPLVIVCTVFFMPSGSWGAEPEFSTPFFNLSLDNAQQPGAPTVVLQIFLLMTVLSLAPAILIMVTSFTRIVIVLSLLRRALGTMQMPPNQVMVGLALFLTFFVMAPVWHKINQSALQPYLDKKIDNQQALQNAVTPLREFMFKQTREKDLALFVEIAKLQRPKNIADIPTTVLIPSFIISEVKTAFQIGLLLYVPFLIIDMVVASVLLSMGMMMLPPIMVSLPFKLMLFVLADGWYLLVGSLVKGFA